MAKITRNSFGDLSTTIQNESKSHTQKTVSSEERDSYEGSDHEKDDSDYEPPQLKECSAAVKYFFEDFYKHLIGATKWGKLRSVENVIDDARWILKLV